MDVGETHLGHREVVAHDAGQIVGSALEGTVDKGGLSYTLTLSNGVQEGEEVHVPHPSGGGAVYLRACGVAPGKVLPMRFVPHIEASPDSTEAWLNTEPLIGIREVGPRGTTLLSFFSISGKQPGLRTRQIQRPNDGRPGQHWDCQVNNVTRGALLFAENVLLDPMFTIATTPAGTRSAIPITGGTFGGAALHGEIVPGGADFPVAGPGGYVLDARYTLKTSDGEYIVVRNCGPVQPGLTPTFEARADGPYSWLNGAAYTSAVVPGNGSVQIYIFQPG